MKISIAVTLGAIACGPGAVGPQQPAPDRRTAVPIVQAAMRAEYQSQATKPSAPLELASDGSELALEAVKATVSIDGPLARTELHFTFRNTENRQREGRFRIELPDGAAVGKFAMKIAGTWRESRVVSREQGRAVYEEFLHRKVDPALLEQDLGNQFSARVFPIAPHEDKEIIIGYDHLVSPEQPYTLALRGLTMVPKLAIAIEHDGVRTLTDRTDAVPEDVIVPIAPGDTAIAGDGGVFVARIAGVESAAKKQPLDRVLILVDTSASRHAMMGKQIELVQKLAAALPARTEIAIAYDHGVVELYRGPAEAASGIGDKLADHGALGASNLGEALARAASSGMQRIVIVGDGVATLGDAEGGKLAAHLAGTAIERVDAIQIGSAVDRSVLGSIVRAGKQRGAILDGRDGRDVTRVMRGLTTALSAEQPIAVAGAETWPKTTSGLAPGEPLFVTGRLRAGSTALAIDIGGRKVRLTARAGDASRVARAVARAELVELAEKSTTTKDPRVRATIDQRIEKVALANNLVSSRTSLIVLETDADEMRTLGPRDGVKQPRPVSRATGSQPAENGVVGGVVGEAGAGETIRIEGWAPMIDPTSTRQGIAIDRDYLKNIPVPGRTFESVLSSAAGSQSDGLSLSGATSLESSYVVEGINTTGVWSDRMSSLANDQLARRMQGDAFALGQPTTPAPRGAIPRAPAPAVTAREPMTQVPSPPTPAIDPSSPYTGELQIVMSDLMSGRREQALERATKWRNSNPGDIAALIAFGESLEARGATALAARAYASIIDLYPNRFELVRAAGERLDRVPGANAFAIDAYRRSLRERPEQLSTHRLLAFALFRGGKASEALDLLLAARARTRETVSRANSDQVSVREVLLQDARVIAAALVARDAGSRALIEKKLGSSIPSVPSMHLVLGWETDANDVDLHVIDKHGNHASYSARTLASGGKLVDDLTDGYGPEMFVVEWPQAFPYSVAVHYFNRGPMGLGIGTVQIIRHDGKGKVEIEDRPFVLQKDGATIPLGAIR